jgi:hypothetical protein
MLTGEQIMMNRNEHAYLSLLFEQRCRKGFGFDGTSQQRGETFL